MKLDLRPLLAEEIRTLPIDFSLEISAEELDGQGANLYGVSFPSPLHVFGEITNTAGYMRMVLSASIPYTTACARCLREVTGTFSFRFEKTVAPAKLMEDIREEDADDYVVVHNGFLDVDEQLSEMLLLEFPSKILCREDCAGLCSRCGKDLNEGPCDCEEHEIDPSLAPLAKLLLEFDEDGEPSDTVIEK